MTGEEKKKRDPIFTACFVIFILAAAGVVGVFVDEHYLTADETVVAYGDTVEVNYVGTFYDYYGEEYAVVFDTSYSSIGNDDSVIKSNSFSTTSFSTLEFTVGGSSVLTDFGNAVVGYKVGDTVYVTIENAYPAGSVESTQSMTGLTLDRVQRMTSAQFESVYDYDLSEGQSLYFTTVYGWQAMAYLDSTTQEVVVTHMPEAGVTYTYTAADADDEDYHSFGTVTFTVTQVSSDTVTFTIGFSDYTTVDSDTGEIQMIELDFGYETWYVTNINGGQFTYKTCEEVQNQTLYFVIEIVSIS